MAEDRLPPAVYERLLWRKHTLRFDYSAATSDPKALLNYLRRFCNDCMPIIKFVDERIK